MLEGRIEWHLWHVKQSGYKRREVRATVKKTGRTKQSVVVEFRWSEVSGRFLI